MVFELAFDRTQAAKDNGENFFGNSMYLAEFLCQFMDLADFQSNSNQFSFMYQSMYLADLQYIS